MGGDVLIGSEINGEKEAVSVTIGGSKLRMTDQLVSNSPTASSGSQNRG